MLIRKLRTVFGRRLAALVTATVVAASAGIAHAVDVMDIPTPDGKPFVSLNIFNKGEVFGSDKYQNSNDASAWTLSPAERGGLRKGISYWANIIGPGSSAIAPAGITVGTYTDENADATSLLNMNNDERELMWSLLRGWKSDDAAQIRIGWVGGGPDTWNSEATMRVLPDNGKNPHLASVMAHEFAHALGVDSSSIVDATTLSAFDRHLVDAAGEQARLGQTVVKTRDGVNFYLPDSGYAFFQGPKVLATLDGAILGGLANINNISGIPINGWEGDNAELSHLELDRSMMSHQNYRNYTGFMEAELALIADIGYDIDVKNFYGKSIYKDGQTMDNTEGFSARNADGTAYVPGQYSATPSAIGLHIYGDNNTVTQRADILSSGFGAAGIRVDSSGTLGNKLTIAPGVKVHADGALGTGLMVAYGKDHEITHRGDLRASGPGGVAARFDFGSNIMGDAIEYRGSFIRHAEDYGQIQLLDELEGPLVKTFDVTGSLVGADKAIYISENAYVANINIMRGASLHGDIISKWDPAHPLIQNIFHADLVTQLTFGLAPDAAGAATAAPDTAFSMQYAGSIDGSLRMRLAGGSLSFNGKAKVLEVINEGRLSGNATYTLSGANPLFTNTGVLAPGNSIGQITIDGNFMQPSIGRLEMEFTPTGSDRLSVTGTTSLDGILALRPTAAYYASGETLHLDSLFEFKSTPSGNFVQVQGEQPHSPTLHATITPAQNTLSATAQVSRLPNAYARFAASDNAARLGSALQGVAEAATGDTRQLFAALDFSALDGSDISHALPQLTPAPYAMSAQANAEANLSMARMALTHLRGTVHALREQHGLNAGLSAGLCSGGDVAPQWSAWVMPFGGGSEQLAHRDFAGYNSSQAGLMGGVYRQVGDLTVGLYTALAHRQMDMWTTAGAQARTEALHLGMEALWRPQGDEGWYAWSQVLAGVENTDMRRKVAFAGYARESQSDWLGFSGTASVGGGWQWRMGSVAFGPQAGLEYALNMQPGIEEWGGQGACLNIDAYTRHDLRGVVGLSLMWDKNLDDQRSIRGNLNAHWRQELLPSDRDMRSHFVGYGDHRFTSRFERQGQGSLGLSGSLQVDLRQDVALGAYIDADVLRTGYSSVGGGLSLRWEF